MFFWRKVYNALQKRRLFHQLRVIHNFKSLKEGWRSQLFPVCWHKLPSLFRIALIGRDVSCGHFFEQPIGYPDLCMVHGIHSDIVYTKMIGSDLPNKYKTSTNNKNNCASQTTHSCSRFWASTFSPFQKTRSTIQKYSLINPSSLPNQRLNPCRHKHHEKTYTKFAIHHQLC